MSSPIFKSVVLLLSAFSLINCGGSRKDIAGHYYSVGDNLFNMGNIQIRSFVDNSSIEPIFTGTSFMEFYPDGTYMFDLHHFEFGDYELKGDSVYLTRDDGKEWQIGFLKDEEFELAHFTFNAIKGKSNLKSLNKAKSYKNKGSYPYSKKNNRWRLTDEEELSKNELIDKMQNYLDFLSKYIKWCNKEKIAIKTSGLAGPLELGRNGLRINNEGKFSKWCHTLQGNNCEESFELLRDVLRTRRVRFKQFKDKSRVYTDVVKQVKKELNELRD